MVSFICDGCQDTVKKSKLQQHYNRCGEDFNCIDCHQRFSGRSWISHTSCISEEEKVKARPMHNNKKRESTERTDSLEQKHCDEAEGKSSSHKKPKKNSSHKKDNASDPDRKHVARDKHSKNIDKEKKKKHSRRIQRSENQNM
ncbi:uncharacterized protein LOC126304668 [Schistocerca gregaria]|uniref:uncharacterized protein LOC126304668 n=1 Tax=Schistocerca gregaria TaxID=7010 RepID=UPI00211DE7F1|nr:uncharacterized protein LOC126304668 [Schistocerca gregaria]